MGAMEDRGPTLLGVGVSFMILALIAFFLRLYVKGVLLRTWGVDDWLMSTAIIFFALYFLCQTMGIVYGTGKHLKDLKPSRAKTALIYWWLCELFYIPSTIFLKLSVGVFLHRIAMNRYHIWIIRLMMIFSGIFGAVYLLLAIFQCQPIKAWWIRKYDNAMDSYGSCFTNDFVVGISFASAALNSIADFTFGILPFFILRDLQMPTRSKKLVGGILGFANIACIATIVRMPFIMDLYHTDDFLYSTVEIALWSNVEVGIGIAAACLATLRPLLRKVFGSRASAWFPDRKRRQQGINNYPDVHEPTSSGGKSYVLESSMPHLRPDNVGHYTKITGGLRPSRGLSKERKDPVITGKEVEDLYESADREQEAHLSSAAEDPGCDSPGIQRAHTPTLEIRKNVEFAFTVEDRDEEDMYDSSGKRSSTPVNWPFVAMPESSGRISPMGDLALPSPDGDKPFVFPKTPKATWEGVSRGGEGVAPIKAWPICSETWKERSPTHMPLVEGAVNH